MLTKNQKRLLLFQAIDITKERARSNRELSDNLEVVLEATYNKLIEIQTKLEFAPNTLEESNASTQAFNNV